MKWWWAVAAVVLPMGISAVRYFIYDERGAKVTATVVQPNFFPFEKFEYVEPQVQADTMLALAMRAPENVDYIVFPETALDIQLDDRDPDVGRFRELLAERYPAARMIIGATTLRFYFPGEEASPTARETRNGMFYDVYNSAMAVDSTAMVEVHHKSKLLIGVERMPFVDRLPWLETIILDLGGTTGSLGTDPVQTVFADSTAAAICWEGVFGECIGGFVRRGAQLLFIISNDSWWGDTSGYRQLFAFSRLRAVETRRAIVRSANTGLSGFIDQRGAVVAQTRWDERTALTAEVATNTRITFYARWGDFVARISVLTFALAILFHIALRFRRR